MHRPVKDGIQTSKELRAFEKQVQRKRSLPLCAVTGNASDSQVNKIKSAGADLVLSKPYQIGDLVQFVSCVMSSLEMSTD